MTTLDLIDDLRHRDVVLTVRGDRLGFDAPAGVLTPEVKAVLSARKSEVKAVLVGDWYGAAMAVLDQVTAADRADLRFIFEERAAIVEYDGGLVRQNAERIAYEHIAGEAGRRAGPTGIEGR